jgi:hypothetical protein
MTRLQCRPQVRAASSTGKPETTDGSGKKNHNTLARARCSEAENISIKTSFRSHALGSEAADGRREADIGKRDNERCTRGVDEPCCSMCRSAAAVLDGVLDDDALLGREARRSLVVSVLICDGGRVHEQFSRALRLDHHLRGCARACIYPAPRLAEHAAVCRESRRREGGVLKLHGCRIAV